MSDGPTDPEAYGPEAVVELVVGILDREGVKTTRIWRCSHGGEYFDEFLDEISLGQREIHEAANAPHVIAALSRAVLQCPHG